MSILNIIQNPHPGLRYQTPEMTLAEIKSKKFQQFLNNLMATLESFTPLGAGLSATQVNEKYRVFAVNLEIDEGEFLQQLLINPQITYESAQNELDWEGCLSFNGPEGTPDQWGMVRRSKQIRVRAQDRHGNEFEMPAQDFYARLIQHEVDHLDGVLFIDKLESELINTEELEELLEEEHLHKARVG